MIQVTVLDAGVGNLGNLARALRHVGAEVEVTTDPETVAAGRCLVLPGVGAFRPPRERLRGAHREQYRVGLEQRVAQRRVGREQGRLQLRAAQRVDAEHADRSGCGPALRFVRRPARAGDPGLQLQARTCDRDARQSSELHVQRIVESAAPAAHLEVCVSRERAHRRGELFDRGAVHQMHAETERDAERDADDREQRAQALVREPRI